MHKDTNLKEHNEYETKLKDDSHPENENSQVLQRIDRKYILSELASVFYLNKGIFYTIKELFVRPGKSVQKFLHNDRNRLVKPITFVIVCSLIYTIAQQYLKFDKGNVQFLRGYTDTLGIEKSALSTIFGWVKQNYGYANILMSAFVLVWVKLLFKKYHYNSFEILILLFYVMGIGTLIYTTFGIFESIADYGLLYIGGIIGFFYSSWAIGQFFDSAIRLNYLKGSMAYLLGIIIFYFILLVIGTGLDLASIG